jgi:lipid II:glycine glycyltransferase (peptidoglycan interpeptide bridge formation enzyme)
MKKYRITDEVDRKQWSDFILNHPEGNIFQTPELFDVFKATKNNTPQLIAVLNEKNCITGILLAVIQKEHSGILDRFTERSIIWGGPLILDNNVEVLNIILKKYNSMIKKKAIYSQFRNLWTQDNEFKTCFEKHGYIYEEHLNILVDLKKDKEQLWKEVNPKGRNKIRKAAKEGTAFMVIEEYEQIEEIYKILEDVYKRAGLPLHDKSLFEGAWKYLSKKSMIKFFGAINNGKIIGTRIVLCFREKLYDWYAGSYKEYQKKNPNDLLTWEVFLWSKRNGYKVFDFGGAGRPGTPYGVRDYKLKFGGKVVNFGRYNKVHKPVLMKIGKLGLKVWKILRR